MLQSYRLILTIALMCILPSLVNGQTEKKIFTATRTTIPPKIDGVLDANIWVDSSPQYVFKQLAPDNGADASFGTQVQMYYDDQALYIMARLLDPESDKIPKELGLRDDGSRNADRFGIVLDTYNKGQNAFLFTVTAAGVQMDGYMSPDDYDENWDAVWNSAVSIDEQGWVVEIEIPYYAFRFPKQEIQTWGVNFFRNLQRKGERSYWNFVDQSVQGFVNQAGTLEGITGVKPPLRLALLPYVSAVHVNDQEAGSSDTKFNGGMDLKYGINESFTVDMSLIPDFSQVQSDDQILNLSAFEVRFSENRPFFTEGTELFSKGGLFYSRRVGQSYAEVNTITDYDNIISTPASAPLLNATKISGRTKKGLGLGFFNAVTNRTYAKISTPVDINGEFTLDIDGNRVYDEYKTVEVEVDPLTNFNVLVVDQNLKNNSNIALINTNVTRANGGENVNFTGAELRFLDKTNTYAFSGFGAMGLSADRTEGDLDLRRERGFKYNMSLGKVSGTWQYEIERYVESDDYDPNDLGFLRSNNEVGHQAEISYNIFNPVWIFNNYRGRVSVYHSRLYKPNELQSWGMNLNFNTQFKNFWSFGMGHWVNPSESYDYFYNSSTANEVGFEKPKNNGLDAWMGTDGRKALYIEIWKGRWKRKEWQQIDHWHGMFMRYRVNNKLSFTYNIRHNREYNSLGWVQNFDDISEGIQMANNLENVVLFGKRNIKRINNIFGVNYIFNNKMGLNLRVRHNWSSVIYHSFSDLLPNGRLLDINYQGLDESGDPIHDQNFNAFNVDLNYSWQIAPGSFVTFNWKNSILNQSTTVDQDFVQNLSNTMKLDQRNTFSIRITYFIDYLTLKNSL